MIPRNLNVNSSATPAGERFDVATKRRARAAALRYGVAVVAAVIAAGVLPAIHPLLGDSIRNGVLLLPVVLLVGVYSGIKAGLACIGISTAALLWYGRDSAHGLFPTGSAIAGSAAFAMIATAILWLGGSRHRAQKQFTAASEATEDEIARLRAEVDEQRQIDEALQHSQLGLARAQRIAHLGSWELDLTTRQFTWSDEMYRILGIQPTPIAPTMQEFLHAIHPEDRDQVVGLIDDSIRDKSSFHVEHRVVRPDGSERIVDQHGELAFDKDNPARMLGAVLDITERHRFEHELRLSEARTRMVVDSALDAVVLTDAKGVITAWNAQAERMFGWAREEAIGRSMINTIIPLSMRQSLKREFRQFLTTGRGRFVGQRTESSALSRDGREFPVEISIAPVELNDTMHFSAFIRDISDHKRSEEALRTGDATQKLLLNELNHRVRNNLAGLISLIDLSAENAIDIPTFAATISRRVHSMAAVHSMLSHSSWGSLTIAEMVERFTPPARRGRICVQGPKVEIPAHQCTAFGMVMGELMANSQRYGALSSPDGLVEVRWTTGHAAGADAHRVLLTWFERGGPSIEHEPAPQVGTNLIRGFVKSDLRGHANLTYPRAGAVHALTMTFDSTHRTPLDDSK